MRSFETPKSSADVQLEHAIAGVRLGRDDALADIMRQHNQRMFRIARSILRNDAEAEDVLQDAFVKAFTELDNLREKGSIGAWLAKITANLAISRLRQLKRREQTMPSSEGLDGQGDQHCSTETQNGQLTPERSAAMSEIRKLIEQEIDRLPDGFREVFVLRVIEQMTIEETSSALDIRKETVKTRLHRAKAKLRAGLEDQVSAASLNTFPFGGTRCQRSTRVVLARLRQLPSNLIPSSHH